MSLLEVRCLRTVFRVGKTYLTAVNNLSFSVEEGKTLALVGESGSGKSVSAMSILNLLDENGRIESGEILFCDGEKTLDLTKLSQSEMRSIHGNKISVIFQEPMTALNPVFSIKRQLSEPFIYHRKQGKKEAEENAIKMLKEVGIASPERVAKQYPHQLSGGMRQRVMIAMALSCEPKLLIADEPTTALDVTIQAQILRLMQDLQKVHNAAILFITHDLGVVKEMADDVAVMYCGQIVERVPAPRLFQKNDYLHPYTEGLLASMPSARKKGERLETILGSTPHPSKLPKGCKFSPRCKYATEKCVAEEPSLFECEKGHFVRCFYPNYESRKNEREKEITNR